MRALIFVVAGAALLVGCGPAKPGASQAGGTDVCAMVADAKAVFGRDVESEVDPAFATTAGGCRWRAADGVVMADAALFTADSMRGDPDGATAQTMFDKQVATVDGLTDLPVEPVEGLGDKATRALEAKGDQTQIVVLKGDQVWLVRAASSDTTLTGPALTERLAHALVDAK